MSKVIAERVCATPEGDMVVFLIGMRINHWWKPHKWIPPMIAMMRMLNKLYSLPPEDTGCLGVLRSSPGLTVIYWRSFEDLEAFAQTAPHRPAWTAFNKAVGKSRGDVGIWHETYKVRHGDHESLYSGMPPHGLGKAVGTVPALGPMATARKRLGGENA